MMFDEFNGLLKKDTTKPTREEYETIIEPVYTWVPYFSKGLAADLYENVGLSIFRDLLDVVPVYMELDKKIHEAQAKAEAAQEELSALRKELLKRQGHRRGK